MKSQFSFKKDGFLILSNFFNKNKIQLISKKIDALNKELNLNKNKKNIVIENKNIKYLQNPQYYINEINEIINSELFATCKKVLNDEVYLKTIDYHGKAKGTSFTPPHQDNFYFCLKPANSLTAYIPLSKQNFKTGSMTVYRGSHKKGVLTHTRSKTAAFSSYIKDEYLEEFKKKYSYVLNIGDLALHHCNLVHYANENNTSEIRKSLALRLNGVSAKRNKKMVNKYLLNLSYNRK